jgi:hypothetical protein
VSFFSAFAPKSDLDVASIRKLASLGFRRWYERQLIESHVWLALCICSMVAFAAGLELLSERRTAGDLLLNSLIVLAGLTVGWLSWRKYACTMVKAESIGVQAVCGSCKHYGFRLLAPAGSLKTESMLRVRCTKCSFQWELQA